MMSDILKIPPKKIPTKIARNEEGSVTVQGLLWFVAAMMLSGIVIDGANGWRTRTQLSVAADAAALAAAQHLDDVELARTAALTVARANLDPLVFGDVLLPEDIVFARYDEETGELIEDEDAPTVVFVNTGRRADNGNAMQNFLLGMVGFDSFDVNTFAMAEAVQQERIVTRSVPGGGLPGPSRCPDTLIMSSGGTVQTGGGNIVDGPICIHGNFGVFTGGGDIWRNGMTFSAAQLHTIQFNTPNPASDPVVQIAVEDTIDPVILPKLDAMFEEMWTTLWEDADALYAGELLPEDLTRDGPMSIVKVDQGWWSIQQGDLQPNTIYLVNHGAQFAGTVQANNVVILTRGQLSVGGGNGLAFHDVFFFADGPMNMPGDISWGDANWCDRGRFDTYLLATQSIGLGGWGGTAVTQGVVIAAPTVQPGGALRSGGGIYLEARDTLQLGGNINLTTCDTILTGHFDPARPEGELTPGEVTVTVEVQKPVLRR